jgi:DNA-directed RNA polymerase alpha subunit
MEKHKEQLTRFSTEALDILEEMFLSLPTEEILPMIQSVKKEREEKRKTNWNAFYKVEDMVLDWDVLQTLKKNNINTLLELMETDLHSIKGITEHGIEQLEWAILFFDMTALQNLPENASQMDVAKTIIKQSKETDKVMAKKYGERYQGK